MVIIEFEYFVCKTSYTFIYDRRLEISDDCKEVILYKKIDKALPIKYINLDRKKNELSNGNTKILYHKTNQLSYENSTLFDKNYDKLDISEFKAISLTISKLIKIIIYKIEVNKRELIKDLIYRLCKDKQKLIKSLIYKLHKNNQELDLCNTINLYKKINKILPNKNVALAEKPNELVFNSEAIVYKKHENIDYERPILFNKAYGKLNINEIKKISIAIFELAFNADRILKKFKDDLYVREEYELSLNIFSIIIGFTKILLPEVFNAIIDSSTELTRPKNILEILENIILKRYLNNICASIKLNLKRERMNVAIPQPKSLNRSIGSIDLGLIYFLELFKKYIVLHHNYLANFKIKSIDINCSKHIKTETKKIVFEENNLLYKNLDKIHKNNSLLLSCSKLKDILFIKNITLYSKPKELSSTKILILNRKLHKIENELLNFGISPLKLKEAKKTNNILFTRLIDELYKANISSLFSKIKYGETNSLNRILTRKINKANKFSNSILNKNLFDIYSYLGFISIARKNDTEIYNTTNTNFIWKKLYEIELEYSSILIYKNILEFYQINNYKTLKLQNLDLIRTNNYKFFRFNTISNMLKSNLGFLDLNVITNIHTSHLKFLELDETNKFILNEYNNIFFIIDKLKMFQNANYTYLKYDFLKNKKALNINDYIFVNLKNDKNIYSEDNKLFISKELDLFIYLHYMSILSLLDVGGIKIYKPKILFGNNHLKNIGFNKTIDLDLILNNIMLKNIDILLNHKNLNFIIFEPFTYLNFITIYNLVVPEYIKLSSSYLGQLYYKYFRNILYRLFCFELLNYNIAKPLSYNRVSSFMQKSGIIRFAKIKGILKIVEEAVRLYKKELDLYLKNVLKFLEIIHTEKIYTNAINIILYHIKEKLFLFVSQIKHLKDITKYKLNKNYLFMLINNSKIVFGFIERSFHLQYDTILNSYNYSYSNELKYKSAEQIFNNSNTIKIKLESIYKLIIEELIIKLILKQSSSICQNQSIILNKNIIYQFLDIYKNEYLKYKNSINMQKSNTIKTEKLSTKIDVEKQTKLKKEKSKIKIERQKKLGKEKGKLNITEEISIDKLADIIVTNEILKLGKEKNTLYIEPIIKLIKNKPELYVEQDTQCLRMYKRGWFLRSVAPTDLLIVPKEDYPYNDYPAVVEAFYEDWDVYYWHHEKTNSIKKHPIPFGTELGIEHTEVSIEIIVDMVNIVLMLWSKFYYAFQQFHGVGAVKSMVQVIYNWLTLETSIEEMNIKSSYDDYMKVYRFFRWEAEKIVHIAKSDYTFGGNYWIEQYIKELFDYLIKHHFDKVPIFKCITKMDFMRDILRDPQGNIDFVLDKIKGMRFYSI